MKGIDKMGLFDVNRKTTPRAVYPIRKLLAIALLYLLIASMVTAQTHEAHKTSMNHGAMTTENATSQMPELGGQSAFMAITEIIQLLEDNPSTDWSTVTIDALRSHLVDMDRLTLKSEVLTETLDETRVRFQVKGQNRTLEAIQRMVPAHSAVVRQTTGWSITLEHIPDGVILLIDTNDSKALIKLRALGFFGYMAIGSHHPVHHYQMASGRSH